MKLCFKCNKTLPYSCFYKHRAMADGYLNKCKTCTKKDVLEHRNKNLDKIREYDRGRANYAAIKKTVTAWRKKYPKKYKAQTAIGNAIRAGLISKQPCESCGAFKAHAHHDDYSMPLAVRWLCAIHHKEWHIRHGEGLNA